MNPISKQTENGFLQPIGTLSSVKNVRSDEHPLVLGIWDLRTAPVTLGGLLFLVEELHAQAMIHEADITGVCFVGGASHPLPVPDAPASYNVVAQLDKPTCARSILLSTLLNLEGIDTCYQSISLTAVKDFIFRHSHTYITWPSLNTLDKYGRVDYAYGTTFFLQRFYNEYGSIPVISAKAQPIHWALALLERRVAPFLPVAVHLKNNPHEQGCSNANFDEWFVFLEACITRYNVRFILIGNEEVDNRIRRLPNVLVTQDLGSTLARDLALIQTSFAFMGMASGPCNMALFSDIPYVIYKNPDHHAEEMASELGEGDRFPFATRFQKVLRVFETSENLMSEFAYLYAHANRQRWERRLASLKLAHT